MGEIAEQLKSSPNTLSTRLNDLVGAEVLSRETKINFVEAANHTEEPASPNRPRGLPRTLQSQEAQQIVSRILGMIQAPQIPH